jgi:hypothetical protein
MLIVDALVDVNVSPFLAEVSPPLPLADVTHDAIVVQLTTLTAHMMSLAESMAAIAASSARPTRGGNGRGIIFCA